MPDDLAVEPAIAETTTDNAIAEPVVAESAPASPEPAVPERDKVQERFDKLTREKYEALRAADTERYERERLQERLRELETKPDPVVPDDLPTLEAHGYDESKYRAAMAVWSRAQARKEAQDVLKQEREEAKRAERTTTWQKKQADFIKSKPDYVEKVQRNIHLPITNDMREAIVDSDMGPEVAYYLADNPDRAIAISQMSGFAAAREIGRIEARLEADKAKPAPAVSKAPAPVPTIEASEPSIAVKPDSPESDEKWNADEWAKRRNKQLSNRK